MLLNLLKIRKRHSCGNRRIPPVCHDISRVDSLDTLHVICAVKGSDKPSGSLHLQDFNSPYHLVEPARPPKYAGTTFVRSPRSMTPAESPQPRAFGWFLLPATLRTLSASALYTLRGCIASRFPIVALALLCLRLNLTSRLRLQG